MTDATISVSLSTSAWTAIAAAFDCLVSAQGGVAIRVDATASGVPSGGGGIYLDNAYRPLALQVASTDTAYAKALSAGATVLVVPQK